MPEKIPEKSLQSYPPVKLLNSDWKNGILIRSPNWLGDAVMALPAIYCLFKLKPESCGLFIACPDNLVPFYKSMQWINYVLPLGSGHSSWNKKIIEEAEKLSAGIGFLFVNSFRSAYYFKKARIKKIFGTSNGLRNLLMSKTFKVNWHKSGQYEEVHQSLKYLSMVYALGAPEWDGQYPDFKLIKESEMTLAGLNDFINEKNIMVVAPGAAYGPAKRWNMNNYIKLCKAWLNKYNGKIIITGAQNEITDSNKLAEHLDKKRIMNLTGKTSLKELIYILKKSKICVSNDSGTMHLGSALDIKGVAVFGSTDPYSTGPLSRNWKVMLKKQSCSPCFSRECIDSNNNYSCLNSITVEDVIKAIDELLDSN